MSETKGTQRRMLTVALPVRDGGNFFKLAIDSILHQTFENWELLVFDDGSRDGAINYLKQIDDSRIKLLQDGFNKGIAYRLNQAIHMAEGEYFARMDHDDICHPERFARQVSFLQKNPNIDLTATKCLTIDLDSNIVGHLPFEIGHQKICSSPWRSIHMPHPSWMGKTAWFREHLYGYPAPFCCEDQELLLRARHKSKYHTIPTYLLAYRISENSLRKKLYTHFAMLKMQSVHFYSRGEVFPIFRAIAFFILRNIASLLNFSSPFLYNCKSVPKQKKIINEWQTLLLSLSKTKNNRVSAFNNEKF